MRKSMMIPWAHVLCLSRSLWMASCPSCVSNTPLSLVICKGAEGALDHFICVTDAIKQNWSQYGPRGAPLDTDLHLQIELLVTTFCLWPANPPPYSGQAEWEPGAECIWILNLSKDGTITTLIVKLFFHILKWSFMHCSLFSLPLVEAL